METDKRSIPYDNYPTYVSSRILHNSVKRENGCIEYGGGKLKHRYGLISITLTGHRMLVPAHRAMWMAVHRDFTLPRNIYVRHKCDNPCCVNIDHLETGTPKDNSADMIKRGRQRKLETYKPHTRKSRVTPEMVRAIRAEPENMKTKHIAWKYKISTGYVSKLRSGKAKPFVK